MKWIMTKEERKAKFVGALNEAIAKLGIEETGKIIAKTYGQHGLGKKHFKKLGDEAEEQTKEQQRIKDEKQKEAKTKQIEAEKPEIALPRAFRLRMAYPQQFKDILKHYSKEDFQKVYNLALNRQIPVPIDKVEALEFFRFLSSEAER